MFRSLNNTFFWLAIILVVTLIGMALLARNQPIEVPIEPVVSEVLTIKSGTSFGECLGYCYKEVVISPNDIVLYQKYQSGNPLEAEPDIDRSFSITAAQWDELSALADIDDFQDLPERIGCPDCADGGAEWIEVSDGATTRKVTIELGADVPEIQPLLDAVRALRTEVFSQIDTE